MKISGFPKIGTRSIKATDGNIFRFNNNPGNKAGNKKQKRGGNSDPFHPAHKKN